MTTSARAKLAPALDMADAHHHSGSLMLRLQIASCMLEELSGQDDLLCRLHIAMVHSGGGMFFESLCARRDGPY
jgi:hypothetical protein